METWPVDRHGQVAQQGRCGIVEADDVVVRVSLTPSYTSGSN